MKTLFAFTIFLTSASAFATSNWVCSNNSTEVAGISFEHGKATGAISWDCFPGGGICNAEADVDVQERNGDLYFLGKGFWLVIHTSQEAQKGSYKAHIIAKDLVDDENQGRGFVFNEFVFCHQEK